MQRRWIAVLAIVILLAVLPLLSYRGLLSVTGKTYGIFVCGGYQWHAGVFPCAISGVNGLDGYEYMSNVYYGGTYSTLHDKVTQLKQQGYARIVGIGYSAGADAFSYEMARNFDDYYAVALIGLPWVNSPPEALRQVKTNTVIFNGGADTTALPRTAYEWYLWLPDSITKDFEILEGLGHTSLGFLNDQTQLGGLISQFVAGTYPKQGDTFTRYVNGEKVDSNSRVTVINPTVEFKVQVSSKVAQYFKSTYGFMQVYEMPGWHIIGRLNPDTTGMGYAGTVTLAEGSHTIRLAGGNTEQIVLEVDAVTSTQEQSYLGVMSLGVLLVVGVVMAVMLIRRHRN